MCEKLEMSFEELNYLAAELLAKNEDWRGNNDYLDPKWVQRFEQALEQWVEEEQNKKNENKMTMEKEEMKPCIKKTDMMMVHLEHQKRNRRRLTRIYAQYAQRKSELLTI